MKSIFGIISVCSLGALISFSAQGQSALEQGRNTLLRQTGCYVVDFSFTEVEALQPGYKIDERVYDTNSNKTTFELIVPITKSAQELRLQHILFVRDLEKGAVEVMMKHEAEDWAFEPAFHYDFVGPDSWVAKIGNTSGQWVRKITNLDDGLRYQCAGAWDFSKANPEWNCANFAPIPGRETRDMGRRDYNTLDRQTRLIVYGSSWVDRQNNVKTVMAANGQRTPLARELGRTWYVRQPDASCDEARAYAATKTAYWKALRETWEEYLSKGEDWREVARLGGVPRYAALFDVEDEYSDRLQADASLEAEVKTKIRAVIDAYRVK